MSAQLGAKYLLLSEADWFSDPGYLREQYGHTQADWPYYLEVKIRGTARNGVQLVGNQGSGTPWVWAVSGQGPIAPWEFTNASASRGGKTFQFRIPCVPPIACAVPHLVVGTSGVTSNGDTCEQRNTLRACEDNSACIQNIGGYEDILLYGQHLDELSCLALGGRFERWPGQPLVGKICCPGQPQVLWNDSDNLEELFSTPLPSGMLCPMYVDYHLFPSGSRPEQCDERYLESLRIYSAIPVPVDRSVPVRLDPQNIFGSCGGN